MQLSARELKKINPTHAGELIWGPSIPSALTTDVLCQACGFLEPLACKDYFRWPLWRPLWSPLCWWAQRAGTVLGHFAYWCTRSSWCLPLYRSLSGRARQLLVNRSPELCLVVTGRVTVGAGQNPCRHLSNDLNNPIPGPQGDDWHRVIS